MDTISKYDRLILLRNDYDHAKSKYEMLLRINTANMNDKEKSKHSVDLDLADFEQRSRFSKYKTALEKFCYS